MTVVLRTTRWEWKVLLAPKASERLQALAHEHLAPDPFALAAPAGAYPVTSVYLAAPGDAAHDGAPRWRVRRYGTEPGVWLERKANRAGRVEKQRVACEAAVAEGAAADLPVDHPARPWLLEVEAQGLEPAVTVGYEREAWLLPGTTARLTLDRRLCAGPAGRRTPDPSVVGLPFLEADVLELKFDDAPPEAFRRLLLAEGLVPRPWSKVRAAARALAGRTAPAGGDR